MQRSKDTFKEISLSLALNFLIIQIVKNSSAKATTTTVKTTHTKTTKEVQNREKYLLPDFINIKMKILNFKFKLDLP